MIRNISTVMALLPLLFGGCTSTPNGPAIRHAVWEPFLFAPLKYTLFVVEEQGPFVEIPAAATLAVTVIPSFAAGMVFFPIIPFLEPGPGEEAIAESWGFMLYFSITASGIVATPFRVTKEVSWDAPRGLFRLAFPAKDRTRNQQDDSQQSDGETTSNSAPEGAASEASHP